MPFSTFSTDFSTTEHMIPPLFQHHVENFSGVMWKIIRRNNDDIAPIIWLKVVSP